MDTSSSVPDVTRLLLRWRDGSQDAFDQLLPIVYAELRRMAQNHMRRESSGHTMQATELVHEAYMRLVGSAGLEFKNRAHFFAIAARVMRQVLVEHARAKGAIKRGGGGKLPLLDEAMLVAGQSSAEVMALDDALQQLSSFDERKSQIVEMRYFGGLTTDQIGAVLDISPATIRRDLKIAHAWLRREAQR